MSTTLDLLTNSKQIQETISNVIKNSSSSYAIFCYATNSSTLEVYSTGEELESLEDEFDDSKILYALLKVNLPSTKISKLVFISWLGEGVSQLKRRLFSLHLSKIAQLLKGYNIYIDARDPSDVELDNIYKKLDESTGSKYSNQERFSQQKPPANIEKKDAFENKAPKQVFVETSSAQSTIPAPEKKEPPTISLKPTKNSGIAARFLENVNSLERDRISENSKRKENVNRQLGIMDLENNQIRKTPDLYKHEDLVQKNGLTRSGGPNKPSIEGNQTDTKTYFNENTETNKDSNTVSEFVKESSFNEKSSNVTKIKENSPANIYSHDEETDLVDSNEFDTGEKQEYEGRESPKNDLFDKLQHETDLYKDSVTKDIKDGHTSDDNKSLDSPKSSPRSNLNQNEKDAVQNQGTITDENQVIEHNTENDSEDPEREYLKNRSEIIFSERSNRDDQIDEVTEKLKANKIEVENARSAIALYTYEKGDLNEISFKEGEYITQINQIDENWWEGQNENSEIGIFPANYVELIDENEEHQSITNSEAIAIYNYEQQEEGEIGFKEDEKITEIVFVSEDWWEGKNERGERGIFPGNYVTLI